MTSVAQTDSTTRAGGLDVQRIRQAFPILTTTVGGKPLVYLYGGAAARAETIGLDAMDISLSHLAEFAIAVVVSSQERREQEPDVARARLVERLRASGRLQ